MVRGNKLEIFENFETDRGLPKFNRSETVYLTGSIPSNLVLGGSLNGSGTVVISNGTSSWGNIFIPLEGNNVFVSEPKGWFSKLVDKFKKKREEKRKTMTILNFFSSLAQSLNDLKVLQDTAIHYETAIANAAKAGQTALVEQYKSRLESAKSELQLVNIGLTQYFTEGQIIDFYNKAARDRNLKLTWIKNFIKPIPSHILTVKENLDNQFVFDNYVILHYDPNNDATDLTDTEKKEIKEREKDPIIFGLISGSRRLYYVADWQDDYCDLTLDVVVETLKERVNEVNNNKVKTYLDTGLRKDERIKIPQQPNYASSATTYQMPTFMEEVKDKFEGIKETFTKSIEDFMPKRKKLGVKQAKKKPIKIKAAKKKK